MVFIQLRRDPHLQVWLSFEMSDCSSAEYQQPHVYMSFCGIVEMAKQLSVTGVLPILLNYTALLAQYRKLQVVGKGRCPIIDTWWQARPFFSLDHPVKPETYLKVLYPSYR